MDFIFIYTRGKKFLGKKKALIFILIFVVLLLTGYIPGNGVATPLNQAGFFSGISHGMLALILFVWSWFDGEIGIYEFYNKGFWYNLGYLISIGTITYSSSVSVTRTMNKDKLLAFLENEIRLCKEKEENFVERKYELEVVREKVIRGDFD
ncbi:hypothetical protein [Paenibacillus sp. FSL P4-0288]|uniref:hypothetical protein n=1 Tax=Paenibacillus sp. FSL P4-0288 TaxID=2921633 RepID=UPI0030FB9A6E